MKLNFWIWIIALLGVMACTKGGDLYEAKGNMFTVSSAASARQLLPAIDTPSVATLSGVYDEGLNNLTFSLTWTDLWRDTKRDTITAVAFYGPASATGNGELVRSLTFINPNRNGTANLGMSGGTSFSTQQQTDFLAGSYYFIITTRRYPAGIVRGQLSLEKK